MDTMMLWRIATNSVMLVILVWLFYMQFETYYRNMQVKMELANVNDSSTDEWDSDFTDTQTI